MVLAVHLHGLGACVLGTDDLNENVFGRVPFEAHLALLQHSLRQLLISRIRLSTVALVLLGLSHQNFYLFVAHLPCTVSERLRSVFEIFLHIRIRQPFSLNQKRLRSF